MTETFWYVIMDNGVSILPGPGDVPSSIVEPKRSDPAPINLTIVETNDAPVFPPSFDNNPVIVEIEPGDDPEVMIDVIAPMDSITPGPLTPPLTSLDELAQQDVTIEFVPVNIPGGTLSAPYGPDSLMAQAPVLLADGTLMIYPTPDAFGEAVFDVEVTDFNRDGSPLSSHTTTERMTITVTGTNDTPVAEPFTKSVVEAVEANGESTSDPAFQILFTADDCLTSTEPVPRLRTNVMPRPTYSSTKASSNSMWSSSLSPIHRAATISSSMIPSPILRPSLAEHCRSLSAVESSSRVSTSRPSTTTKPRLTLPPPMSSRNVIADSGLVTVPGTDFTNSPAAADQVDLGTLRSEPASITFT